MTTPASTTGNTPATAGALSDAAATQLRRLRWAVRATLTLGVAASVAANVLHARPNPISQIIAAWPPLALLLTVELISRVPHHRRLLGVIRIAATAVIASIATWVSYWHLVGVAARYGETEAAAAYLLPLSVDGLVVVASVSLVEITGRLRTATAPDVTRESPLWHGGHPRPDEPSLTAPTAASVAQPVARRSRTPKPARETQPTVPPAPSPPRIPTAPSVPTLGQDPPTVSGNERVDGHKQSDPAPTIESTAHVGHRPEDDQARAHRRTPADPNTQDPHPAAAPATGPADQSPASRPHGNPTDREHPYGSAGRDGDVVPAGAAAAVAYWHRRDPGLHPAQIATRIGRSERTVRRHWPHRGDAAPANGNPADAAHS